MSVMSRSDVRSAVVMSELQGQRPRRRDLTRLSQLLATEERVQRLGVGVVGVGLGRGRGLLVITDHRVLLIRQGWIFQTLEVMDRSKITSAQWNGSVLTGTLLINASGRVLTIPGVLAGNGQQLTSYLCR
ncbi:hypothetical protein OG218_02140 [Kineococcus sp. NBC_00420]|uniref:hypothetical protein n=1 Tax=Kineococcus sp. NBC_00420 TaxID=2903564 RepID=UPI002E1FBC1C